MAELKQCDVIMKGGITSGVIYPSALVKFAQTYRFRRLGGASAGAIGAAFGAAAEHGRQRGGFERLAAVPTQLADGKLAALFQPQRTTKAMLPLLLTATGHDRPGPAAVGSARIRRIVWALLRGWPGFALIGALPGVLLVLWGFSLTPAVTGAVGVLLAMVVLLLGLAIGVGYGVWRTLTGAVPANQFGICTGLQAGGAGPGFTDWLSREINQLAGRDAKDPLLFGHLWTGSDTDARYVSQDDRQIDLRMVSTCVSHSRPYEMPWEAAGFFYEPAVWAKLFPDEVMDALENAPVARPEDSKDTALWAWEETVAAGFERRGLRRLPAAEHLPVIVSVRMSLSFPLLISAIPLWRIDWRSEQSRQARARGTMPVFHQLWFTDGGFCSNFPVHLFDDALPVRPVFAINLGNFLPGRTPSADESENIEYARSNRPLQPSYHPLATSGFAALKGFFEAAFATSREWPDATQLATPGLRDRVVRVLQSDTEGGLNLYMDTDTINALANRGEAAAEALVTMFNEPHYRGATGWDNHRWVRYRAFFAALPKWLDAYAAGRAELGIDPAKPPAYDLSAPGRTLAEQLASKLDEAAALASATEGSKARRDLTNTPRPVTAMRRVPVL